MLNNKNLRLSLQERQFIQTGIENSSIKSAIALITGKDKSTDACNGCKKFSHCRYSL